MNVQKNFAFKIIRIQLNLLSRISPKLTGKQGFRLFTTPISLPTVKKTSSFQSYEQVSFLWNRLHIRGFRCNTGAPRKALILHGFSSSVHTFEHFINPLIEKGYEVLAFNAPAHGDSDGKRAHALDYAAVISEIGKHFGPIDAYVAHSFGGLGLALALENISAENVKAVLIAPATETTTAIKAGLKLLGVDNKKVGLALENEIQTISGRPAEWFSIRRAIKNSNASFLWIHDADDDITPLSDVMPVQDDANPNIEFIFTSQLGHRKIYRDETVMEHVINFLS